MIAFGTCKLLSDIEGVVYNESAKGVGDEN
jgi:hypothetical protein